MGRNYRRCSPLAAQFVRSCTSCAWWRRRGRRVFCGGEPAARSLSAPWNFSILLSAYSWNDSAPLWFGRAFRTSCAGPEQFFRLNLAVLVLVSAARSASPRGSWDSLPALRAAQRRAGRRGRGERRRRSGSRGHLGARLPQQERAGQSRKQAAAPARKRNMGISIQAGDSAAPMIRIGVILSTGGKPPRADARSIAAARPGVPSASNGSPRRQCGSRARPGGQRPKPGRNFSALEPAQRSAPLSSISRETYRCNAARRQRAPTGRPHSGSARPSAEQARAEAEQICRAARSPRLSRCPTETDRTAAASRLRAATSSAPLTPRGEQLARDRSSRGSAGGDAQHRALRAARATRRAGLGQASARRGRAPRRPSPGRGSEWRCAAR